MRLINYADVFNKFKNDQGKFYEALANDIQGLCSLYEAAHLRTHKDAILEEACDFSNTQVLGGQTEPIYCYTNQSLLKTTF